MERKNVEWKRDIKNWGRDRKGKDWIGRERKSKKAKRKERTGNERKI